MLNSAISFFPALREIGVPNLKGECEPFPEALPVKCRNFFKILLQLSPRDRPIANLGKYDVVQFITCKINQSTISNN